MKTDEQHLIFRQQGRLLALPISGIAEIIRMALVKPLPEQPAYVAGVLNYRGELLPVLDLWYLLGREAPPLRAEMGIIITAIGGRRFGLIVEEMVGVKSLEPRPRPDDLVEELAMPLVEEVCSFDQSSELVLLLNPERLREQVAALEALPAPVEGVE
jgi:purine-binding chemotaxis protein CheW